MTIVDGAVAHVAPPEVITGWNDYTWALEFYVTEPSTVVGLWHYRASTAVSANVEMRVIVPDATGTSGTTVAGTTITFPASSAVGWRYMALPAPVTLQTDRRYRVCAWMANGVKAWWPGYFGADPGFAGRDGLANGPLVIPPASRARGGLQCCYGIVPSPVTRPAGFAYPKWYDGNPLYGLDVRIDVLPPKAWQTPTAKTHEPVETFSAALSPSAWSLYSTSTPAGPVPSVSGGRLSVPYNAIALTTTICDLKNDGVVAEAVDVIPEGDFGGGMRLGWDSDAFVVAYTGKLDGYPVMQVEVYRYGTLVGVHTQWFYPDEDRWWRFREADGLVHFDTAPAAGGPWWQHCSIPHRLPDAALGAMPIGFLGVGNRPTLGPVRFDNLNTVPVTGFDTVPDPHTLSFLGWGGVDLDRLHGRDTLVAILDCGVSAPVRARHNITRVGRQVFSAATPAGDLHVPGPNHGCFVAANGVPTGGQFLDMVVGEPDGSVTDSRAAAAILAAAQQGAHVVNCSFGGYSSSSAYEATFQAIADQNLDCVVYCSTANDGSTTVASPATYSRIYPHVKGVGAADERIDARASFSNYGLGLSALAPGSHVTSYDESGLRLNWSGTSAACPLAVQTHARHRTVTGSSQVTSTLLHDNLRDLGLSTAEQGGGVYDLHAAVVATAAGSAAWLSSGAWVLW